jgi:hypothetical protein
VLTTGEAYDPYFYANQALRQLNKSLGMAFFVHRGYDKSPQEKGSTIKLRRPGKFTAQNMPIATSSAEDIDPDYLDIVLNQWKGTMFKLTDKELTYSRQQLVDEHIGPLAIGVADAMDQGLNGLLDDVPWFLVSSSSAPVEDFADVRKIMVDNQVPNADRRFMVGGNLQARYEKESVFYQANTGVDAELLQRDGFLGKKFGFDLFTSQNATGHTAGATGTDDAGAILAGGFAKGATTVSIDDLTDNDTFVIGDSFVVAGNTQRYALNGDFTVASNTIAATIPEPGLLADVAADAVVTLRRVDATERGCAFHKDAFALAMAPLSSLGNGAGAKIATMTDPITNITVRATIFYDGGAAANYVRIDALWGVKTLDFNLACNVEFA